MLYKSTKINRIVRGTMSSSRASARFSREKEPRVATRRHAADDAIIQIRRSVHATGSCIFKIEQGYIVQLPLAVLFEFDWNRFAALVDQPHIVNIQPEIARRDPRAVGPDAVIRLSAPELLSADHRPENGW